MQADMPRQGRVRDGARGVLSRALRFSLGATLALVFGLAQVNAQSDQAVKPAGGEGGATTTGVRERRVAESQAASVEDAGEVDSAQTPPVAGEKGTDRLSTLREQIAQAKTETERARLQRTLVDYLVALGKQKEAIAELRLMMREERVDPVGFYNIGNALARLGDTDTAIDAYRKAINQRHGNYARAFNNLGVMLLRQGRWDEAQEALTSALRLENFRYSEASYNLGRVYSMRGEAALAIREWNRALAVQPDHADAAIALARAYSEDGSPERGLAVLDTFISRRGPTAELTDARREILFGTETGGNATTLPAKVESTTTPSPSAKPATVVTTSERAPGTTTNSKQRVETRNSSGVKSGSGKRAATAAALRPLSVDRETYDLLQRAREAREGGRDEEAVKLYRRVLSRSNGFFPPANLELGFVLNGLKRFEESAAVLSTLTSREGARYPISYYHLGRQYESLGKLNLAAEAFEKAVAAFGEANPQFLLDLSRVREKEGNSEAALAAMEAYVRISRSLGRAPEWSDERLAQLRQKAGKN